MLVLWLLSTGMSDDIYFVVVPDHLYVICPYLLAVLVSEYFVDWIKHAFITKFNNIPVEVCIVLKHLSLWFKRRHK